MPIPSNNYKPFLTYLDPREYVKLKKFAAKNKIPMTQLVREAVTARISGGNVYVNGFNDGLQAAIDAVNATTIKTKTIQKRLKACYVITTNVRRA
jgi:hypothetical protein